MTYKLKIRFCPLPVGSLAVIISLSIRPSLSLTLWIYTVYTFGKLKFNYIFFKMLQNEGRSDKFEDRRVNWRYVVSGVQNGVFNLILFAGKVQRLLMKHSWSWSSQLVQFTGIPKDIMESQSFALAMLIYTTWKQMNKWYVSGKPSFI